MEKQVPPNPQTLTDQSSSEVDDKKYSGIILERPSVKWEEVFLCEKIKQEVIESFILPQKFPQLFQQIRQPVKSMLIYGPPGVGKTMLIRAIASQSGISFFPVGLKFFLDIQHQPSTEIKEFFKIVQAKCPSIIFLDEIHCYFPETGAKEKHGLSQKINQAGQEFYSQLSELQDALIIAESNAPWAIEKSFIPRFQKHIYVEMPDQSLRAKILESLLKDKMEHTLKPDNIDQLAAATDGFSGADLVVMVRSAIMLPLRRLFEQGLIKGGQIADTTKIPPATPEDFLGVLSSQKPSIDHETVEKFASWKKSNQL